MDMRRRSNAAAFRIYLRCLDAWVLAEQLVQDPVLSALAVEDVCWYFSRDDWFSREPRRWQRRKLARWRAEGQYLQQEQQRLRSIARRCGLGVG